MGFFPRGPVTPRHLLEDYNEKENKLMCSTVANRVMVLRDLLSLSNCFPTLKTLSLPIFPIKHTIST